MINNRERPVPVLVAVLLFAVTSAAFAQSPDDGERSDPPARELVFEFIGNEAFRITDGQHVLYSDFPYESGYSIYNEYDAAEIVPDPDAVTIITHRHRDHFDADLFASTGWTAYESEGDTLWGDVVLTPVPTPHAGIPHRSWLVDWSGIRMYFVGDTEDSAALLAQRDLDLAFVSPWLYEIATATGRKIDARQIVIYHHTGPNAFACNGCLVPKQGQQFSVADARRQIEQKN